MFSYTVCNYIFSVKGESSGRGLCAFLSHKQTGKLYLINLKKEKRKTGEETTAYS